MNLKRTLTVAVLGTSLVGQVVRADDADDLKALKAQIEALDQKVRVLERNDELDKDAAADKAKAAPVIKLDSSGFTFSSADTNFTTSLHGLVQFDNRTFFGDKGIQGADGFLLRRVRPIFSGTVYHDFDYLFTPDFGGTSVQIFDAYVNYRYQPWLQFRAGKFKTPVGLEVLQSDPYTSFNERSVVSDLLPNRDVGFQVWGDIGGGVASYAVGVFNGVGDERNSTGFDFDNNREFAARLFFQPFKKTDIGALRGFGFGVGGAWGESSVTNTAGLPSTTGGSLAGYTTDGQQQFFAYNPATGQVLSDGSHWRISPQAYYFWGPFSLMGEYAVSDQHLRRIGPTPAHAELQNTAWEVTAGWVLTGEDAGYNGVTPRHSFDPRNGGWGAWQLVARYGQLDIDNNTFPLFSNPTSSATGLETYAVGLNWYLNRDITVKASYSHTGFTGGGTSTAATSPAAVTRGDEDVFFTRIQLSF
jgi:phosphate-selective porin OprO/OprP